MLLKNAPTLPLPGGHYSHSVTSHGLVFISGLLPIDSAGKKLNQDDFSTQTKQVLFNLDAILKTNNCTAQNLVQVRVYIVDIENWGLFNRIYADWVGDHKPARCVVPVSCLHYNFALELEAVAELRS